MRLMLGTVLFASCLVATAPRLVVLPLEPRRLDPATASVLDAVLVDALAEASDYDILGARDVDAMLGAERLKDAIGCTSVMCASEIGLALGAQLYLSGTAARLGDELVVFLTLIDVGRGVVMSRGSGRVIDREERYRLAVIDAAAEVLKLPASAPAGAETSSGDEDAPRDDTPRRTIVARPVSRPHPHPRPPTGREPGRHVAADPGVSVGKALLTMGGVGLLLGGTLIKLELEDGTPSDDIMQLGGLAMLAGLGVGLVGLSIWSFEESNFDAVAAPAVVAGGPGVVFAGRF